MKTVIIGFGWVGQANALALVNMGYKVYFFDPQNPEYHYRQSYGKSYQKIRPLDHPLQLDSEDTTYIVCVGDKVLPSGEQDITNIKKALDSLALAKGSVVLRSTVLPIHLKDLHFHFYIPEFLHEKKAVEESLKPHFFAIGDRQIKPEPDFVKKWKQAAYKVFEGTPEEASYVKYLSNIWNALRISFVNEFGNAIVVPKEEGHVRSIEKIVDFIFGGKSYLRYGKGFGGHCLPKDTLAFHTFHSMSDKDNLKYPLLKAMIESNEVHTALHKENNVVKEWFSEWERPEISGTVALQALIKAARRKKTLQRLKNIFKGN